MTADPSIPELAKRMAALAGETPPHHDKQPRDASLQEAIDRIRMQSPLGEGELAKKLTSERPFLTGPDRVSAYIKFVALGRAQAQSLRAALEKANNPDAHALQEICNTIIGQADDAWIAKARSNPSAHTIREETTARAHSLAHQLDSFRQAHQSFTEASLAADSPAPTYESIQRSATGFMVALQNAAALLPGMDEPGKGGAGR